MKHKFSMGLDTLANAMLKPINTAAIIIMGIFTIVWGSWIANPFWDVFSRADLYSFMSFLPETFWGGVAIIVGLCMMYGVIRHSYKSLKFGAQVGFYHWMAICTMFFAGDWQNTGGPTALMIAVYCGFIYLNLKVNKKLVESAERKL